MFDIKIRRVDHNTQRYNTISDYTESDEGETLVTVSKLKDSKMELVAAVHCLVESYLCKQAHVSIDEIDDFSFAFDDSREYLDSSIPGDHPEAPHYQQHTLASKLDSILCDELGLSLRDYETATSELIKQRQLG